MIWVFLVIALAAISFSITIIMQHLTEASGFRSKTDSTRAEHEQAETQMQESVRARDLSKQEAAQATQVVAKLQTEADELKNGLNKVKKDRERRGKYKVGGNQ